MEIYKAALTPLLQTNPEDTTLRYNLVSFLKLTLRLISLYVYVKLGLLTL